MIYHDKNNIEYSFDEYLKKTDVQFILFLSRFLIDSEKRYWLTNMTHLYVMSTTNLFHLEGSSKSNRVKKSRNQSVRSSASRYEFRSISNIFQSKRLYRLAVTIYLSSNALCYQFSALIESFNTLEMSVVSTSIDRLSETTRAKKNT